jgi:hypothetical protein
VEIAQEKCTVRAMACLSNGGFRLLWLGAVYD